MLRRQFLGALGGAAVAWPVSARAQQAAMPVVGYLFLRSANANQYLTTAFKGLGETGYIEGKNVTFEYRCGNNRAESMLALAASSFAVE